jgi:hypothetical protein
VTALRLRPLVASAAVAGLLLGACGDDDEAPTDPGVENQDEVDAGDDGGTDAEAPEDTTQPTAPSDTAPSDDMGY